MVHWQPRHEARVAIGWDCRHTPTRHLSPAGRGGKERREGEEGGRGGREGEEGGREGGRERREGGEEGGREGCRE